MSESFDRAAIKARAEAATPGPWWGGGDRSKRGGAHPYGLVGRVADRGTGNAIAVLSGVGMDRVADAEFIAHAREDIPALLAALEEEEILLEARTYQRDIYRGQLIEQTARAEDAERRIAAVEEALYADYPRNDPTDWTEYAKAKAGSLDAIRAALHSVAETTEKGNDDE